ncbi:E3 ubiquitin-protein ligase RNF4-like [Senna tora]|uniref:E3 ubiquitin-protein ligase RNF4-like n=1 Tax=Senna tora TaxID=362788 RepID=A0A834SS42_9FABA|nr:E3 ubiquitin-protein ligase RNF4-like [Senna tora]
MSTRALRAAAVRSYKRRKTALDLDLNCAPPGENREQEDGPSQQIEPQEVQAGHQQPVLQPAMIDVEAIDDDVVESSPRAFAEAKNNSRRNRLRTIVVVDLDNVCLYDEPVYHVYSVLFQHPQGKKRLARENVTRPPEPPKEPVFNCPICMCPLEEEMSTRVSVVSASRRIGN